MMAKRALVIENDPTILECIEVIFESEGLEVISARNGEEGIELIHRYRPDLVVSDLYMSGLSGLDLFERLRSHPDTCDIPFLFITADARDSVREHCLSVGAEGFLLKPFTFDQLMAAARPLLGDLV